jgi:hypothetical protein
MMAALRPMSLGEILDRSFQIYRSRFWTFATIGAIPASALLLVRVADIVWWKIPATTGGLLFHVLDIGLVLNLLLFFHVGVLFQFLAMPVSVRVASCEALARRCTIVDAFRHYWSRPWANAVLGFLLFLMVLIAPELLVVLADAGAGSSFEALGIDTSQWGPLWSPMMVISIAVGWAGYFWMTSLFALSWPVLVTEPERVWRSIGRGKNLSGGGRRRLIAAQTISATLWWMLTLALVIAIQLVVNRLRADGFPYHTRLWVLITSSLTAQWVTSVLIAPIYPIAITLIYYDQRIRKEGYDIERMMDAAGMSAPPVPAMVAAGDSAEAEVQPG